MANLKVLAAALAALLISTGCAVVPTQAAPAPVRLDELLALSRQGVGDDAVIAQLARRGVAFVLVPQDATALRESGVSEGVLRYLQGRGDSDAVLAARIQQGRYSGPGYYGALYLGYPYLGYAGGLHYYGGLGLHAVPRGVGHPGYGLHDRHGRHGGHGGHGRSHGGGGRH